MTSVKTVLILGLVAFVSCLPPPSPRNSFPETVEAPRRKSLVDHRLDLLRLSAAVTPLLNAFLTPIVESLPDDYLEEFAAAIKRETLPDPLTHNAQLLEDEDKLQLHEDYNNNVIIKNNN